jgi:hypothetical protein
MKVIPVLLGGLALTACATGGSIEKVSMAEGASGVMLTSARPEDVAQCMARLFQTEAQPVSNGFSVASSAIPQTYRVTAFADPLNRYPTRVDILGPSPSGRDPNASSCLGAGLPTSAPVRGIG